MAPVSALPVHCDSGPGTPTLSVVVPTHQRCELLNGLLRGLQGQTLPAEQYEVIVIVDGSTDGTCRLLSEFDAGYTLRWRWQPNAGRAAACNAGIALARGELVVLLDDDMQPTPSHLEAHLSAHAGAARRAVMGAVPIVTPPGADAVVRYVARKFSRRLEALARRRSGFILPDFYSGNVSIRRDVLNETGGFDEAFTMYGNEDLELWYRLRSAGVDLAFSETALAYQRYVKDFRALARDNIEKGKTAVLLASKHPAAVPEMKLSALARARLRRRILLRAMVTLTRVWPAIQGYVVQALTAASRIKSAELDRVYALAADYYFLLGAAAARDTQQTDVGSRPPQRRSRQRPPRACNL